MADQPSETSFLNDVKSHSLEVLRDDGVYRHLRFSKNGSSVMRFDIITYPGHLCYSGDMGSYVFTRLHDMLEFFRTDRVSAYIHNPRGDSELVINPSYWAEKLVSVDRSDGIEKFDEDRFNKIVMEYLLDWIRNHKDRCSKEERRSLWDAVIDEVLNADGDGGGYRKQVAAHDFRHFVNDDLSYFSFQDFWGRSVTSYSYRFMWCCYALAWGIKKYDDTSKAPEINEANYLKTA